MSEVRGPTTPTEVPGLPSRRTDAFQALLLAAGASAGVGLILFAVSVLAFGEYGFFVFLASPLAMGAAAGRVLRRVARDSAWMCVAASVVALLLVSTLLLILALEGAICLAMAAPLALPVHIVSSLVAARIPGKRSQAGWTALVLCVLLPLTLGADRLQIDYPVRPVRTEVLIDASPAAVWSRLIDFAPLPPPRERVFRLGIAHPLGARIEGSGVGAVRYCEFSTGPFVEPITHWEPPRRLAFDVAAQPEPMHEWSPYRTINAPHLADGLVSHRGEFLLEELPGGRTRLIGTTWYEVRMAPQFYWRAWSDEIIGAIHRRVLHHVKERAESGSPS